MVIHYAGGLDFVHRGMRHRRLRGWAACVSGERAYAIRDEGNVTPHPEDVTCKRCLELIRKAFKQ